MATTTAKPELLVGKRLRRREDPRLITGTATYVDDIKMPGMLYAVIVRSPHAAASIKSMDISKAAAHHCRGCGCLITIFWRRSEFTLWVIPWRWWSRPIATSRRMRRT